MVIRYLGCALVIGLLSVTRPAISSDPDLLWGVNGHPLVSYPGVSFERQLDYVNDLGLRSYRVNVRYMDDAPGLARLVELAKPHGIEILPVITPAFDLDSESAPDLYDKAHELAAALVSRFKDDIRVWELGNEMEVYAILQPCEMRDDGVQYPCDWGPAGGVGALEYYGPRWEKVSAVLKGLSDGVISVDPTIRKAMGTAGWGHTGAFTRMQQDGIQWDISVWHMYGEDPEWAFKILADFGRPIWVTEFNNPYGSQKSEAEQVAGLTRAMMRLRELREEYNVEAAHIYELLDEPYWAPSFEAHMGLVRLVPRESGGWAPGHPKPAYHAVKELVRGTVSAPVVERDCDLKSYDHLDSGRHAQVTYSYCLILGRSGDGAGLRGWTMALERGTAVSEMLRAMLLSEEFSQRYAVFGLGNADFVTLMYRLLLDQGPHKLSDYVSQLDAGTLRRNDLIESIVGSDEFRSKHRILFSGLAAAVMSGADCAMRTTGAGGIRPDCDLGSFEPGDAMSGNRVAYSFCLILARPADGAGLEGWTAALDRGMSVRQLLLAMMSSDEFNTTHAISKLGSSEFVTLMYRLLLGREPDGHGHAGYRSQLDAGSLNRVDVQSQIIDSGEFRSKHPILFRPTSAAPASPGQAK